MFTPEATVAGGGDGAALGADAGIGMGYPFSYMSSSSPALLETTDDVLTPQLTRGAIAIHEAGHAVVAHSVNQHCLWISLAPGLQTEASTQLPDLGTVLSSRYARRHGTSHAERDALLRAFYRERLLIAVAGSVAFVIKYGCAQVAGNEEDLRLARQAAVRIGRGDWKARIRHACDEAETLLRARWDSVELLADDLLRTGYLDGARVLALLAPH